MAGHPELDRQRQQVVAPPSSKSAIAFSIRSTPMIWLKVRVLRREHEEAQEQRGRGGREVGRSSPPAGETRPAKRNAPITSAPANVHESRFGGDDVVAPWRALATAGSDGGSGGTNQARRIEEVEQQDGAGGRHRPAPLEEDRTP